MPAPLVSLITHPRRGPHFLRSLSIPSVLRQTRAEGELIVVDGGGDDSLSDLVAGSGCARGQLERTEALAERVVRLPMYNEIRDETVALIAEVVREAVA